MKMLLINFFLVVKMHFHSRDGNVSSEVLGDDTLYDCGVGEDLVMVDVGVSSEYSEQTSSFLRGNYA